MKELQQFYENHSRKVGEVDFNELTYYQKKEVRESYHLYLICIWIKRKKEQLRWYKRFFKSRTITTLLIIITLSIPVAVGFTIWIFKTFGS